MHDRTRRLSLLACMLAAASAAGCLPPPAPPPTSPPPPETPPPGPTPTPVDVVARAAANGRAVVSWRPGAGAPTTQYLIQTREGGQVVAHTFVAGADTVTTGLAPGHSYDFAVVPIGPEGTGIAAATNTITAVGAVAPDAVTAVTASADASSNRVTVTWDPPAGGPAPESYNIGVHENGSQVGAFICYAPCNERVVNLTPGAEARFTVDVANPAGRSLFRVSNIITVPKPCPLACVSVDATSGYGTATRRAAGFLNSIGPKTDANVIAPLRPSQWRTGMVNRPDALQHAAATGARVTELLSDDWWERTKTWLAHGAAEPWADWSRYTNFIRDTMAQVASLGIPIEYWDVQNEPGSATYYASRTTPTVHQLLTQFKVAYETIKSVDPGAKVVAPSLVAWNEHASQSPGQLDMRTFLDFAVLNGLELDAISFHDNSYYRRPDEYAPDGWGMQPDEVNRSVDRLRKLLADRPSLGDAKIVVNEYADPYTFTFPGWSVGRIAALERADVDEANRTCWNSCDDGYLAGLLTGDGRTTKSGYWVYAFYASMDGERAPVTTTFSDVTAYAAVDSSQTTRVLVGRHEGCRPDLGDCQNQPILARGDVSLTVRVPFTGNAAVVMAAIPAVNGPLEGPTSEQQTIVPVAPDGTLALTLPQVADGDAWQITISPA